jgi:hypothetical protein
VNQRDLALARQKLAALTSPRPAPAPAPAPPDSGVVVDTTQAVPPGEPADTIRLAPPR